MRKAIKLVMSLGVLTPIVISSTSVFTSTNNNYNQDLQAILWSLSIEKKAQLLTQFRTAKLQFDDVIKKNQAYLATDVVKVDKTNDYQVSFEKENLNNKFVPVVVTDLDETLLDNTPSAVFNYFNNNSNFSEKNWHEWVIKQTQFQNQIYLGVLEFVKHVWQNGGMVLFVSDRKLGDFQKYGDETKATRETLINNGYPKSFLDSYVWWLKGVSQYLDNDWKKLESKENRFNYLNDLDTKLKSRTMQEFSIKDGWDDVGPELNNLPIHIVMKIGDNINDFNDNLTNYHLQPDVTLRNNYLENQNINNLFGQAAREIWFTKEKDKCIEHYWQSQSNEPIDYSFLEKKYVNEIKEEQGNDWKNSYLQIGGNANYGSWLDTFKNQYGQDAKALEKILWDYYQKFWNSLS